MKTKSNHSNFLSFTVACLSLLTLFSASFASTSHAAEKTFKMYTVEIMGTKFWLPSTIVVKKGDKVKIHAESKLPGDTGVHGFTIEAYKIQDVVSDKGKDFEFVADKTGAFNINCQLHPGHVGAQLVVLP